jgi:hypothetical protein
MNTTLTTTLTTTCTGGVCAPTSWSPRPKVSRRPTQEYPWTEPQVMHLCNGHDCVQSAMTVESAYAIRLEWAVPGSPCHNCGGV